MYYQAGLGFRQFGRFEGLAKSDQQKCTEMYRKHADFGYEIQVGYEHFGGKWKIENVQECTKMYNYFQVGYGDFEHKTKCTECTKMYRFLCLFPGGIQAL